MGHVVDEPVDGVDVRTVVKAPLEEDGRRRTHIPPPQASLGTIVRVWHRHGIGDARTPHIVIAAQNHTVDFGSHRALENLPVMSIDPVHGGPALQACGSHAGPPSERSLSQERRCLTRFHIFEVHEIDDGGTEARPSPSRRTLPLC